MLTAGDVSIFSAKPIMLLGKSKLSYEKLLADLNEAKHALTRI